MDDRGVKILIDDTEYELILTTLATKEIAKKYGGLGNLGEKLMKPENIGMAFDELVWLIVLLANQSIMIHNYKNPDTKKELLTSEYITLFTSPVDLAELREPLSLALLKGTKRHIESEETSAALKNE